MLVSRLARWAAAALVVAAVIGPARPAETPADVSPAAPAAVQLPEWFIKLLDIALKDPMRGTSSPLAVSRSPYGWEWLAQRHGVGVAEALKRTNFRGPKELFDRLDRNGDGVLEVADFDWSDRSPFVHQQAVAMSLFNRLNTDGNGEVSAQEWQALFKQIAGDKGTLTTDDLRRALFVSPDRGAVAPPTRLTRLLGFLSGELGSFREGPDPGQLAPDFALRTEDGNRTIHLSEFRGHKPVVLIFGNFT